MQYGNRLPRLDGPADHASDTNASDILIMVDGRNHNLQRRIFFAFRHRDFLHQGREQRFQTIAFIRHVQFRNPGAGRRIDYRKIKLFFGGAQFDEQVQYFIDDFFGPFILPVNLIDDHDRFQFLFQRFTQHILGLRHRPLECIYQ